MPKITLPPQVKCWRCEGTGRIIGLNNHYGPCDCDDGERYVFDDLAAAVVEAKAGFNVASYSEKPSSDYWARIFPKRGYDRRADGPNPTTALLMAIEKFNEEKE